MTLYSRTWDENQPPGSQAPSSIDDDIRALKADIRERMNTLLVAGHKWDTSNDDAIQLDPAAIGGADGIQVFVPFSAWTHADETSGIGSIHWNAGYITEITGKAQYYVAPLHIPSGSVVTQLDAVAKISIGGTAIVDLKRSAISAAGVWTTETTLSCPFNNDGNFHTYTASGLSITLVKAFRSLFIYTPNTGDQWIGVAITYNKPGLADG
jgi:hypothetical protein